VERLSISNSPGLTVIGPFFSTLSPLKPRDTELIIIFGCYTIFLPEHYPPTLVAVADLLTLALKGPDFLRDGNKSFELAPLPCTAGVRATTPLPYLAAGVDATAPLTRTTVGVAIADPLPRPTARFAAAAPLPRPAEDS